MAVVSMSYFIHDMLSWKNCYNPPCNLGYKTSVCVSLRIKMGKGCLWQPKTQPRMKILVSVSLRFCIIAAVLFPSLHRNFIILISKIYRIIVCICKFHVLQAVRIMPKSPSFLLSEKGMPSLKFHCFFVIFEDCAYFQDFGFKN